MGEPSKVRPKEHRFGEIRMGSTDLGTRNIDGRIKKPGVEYVMGRNESHRVLIEQPLLSIESLVPVVFRGMK